MVEVEASILLEDSCLAVVTLPKNLIDAVRTLEGRNVEEGLRSIILNRVAMRLHENQLKTKEFTRRYGSIQRLRGKILRSPHGWREETELFDWESLRTENKRLKKILAEAAA